MTLAAVVSVSSCHRLVQPEDSGPNPRLQGRLEAANPADVVKLTGAPRQEATALLKQVQRFYAHTGFRFAWLDGDHPNGRYEQLVRVVRNARHQGLDPDGYEVTNLGGVAVAGKKDGEIIIPEEHAVDFDVKTTFALFRYATHLTAGQLDPHALESQWTLRPQHADLVDVLAQAVTDNKLPTTLDRIAPQHPEYVALQHVLDRYLDIQSKGGWSRVPEVRRLKDGDSSDAVPLLRTRLAVSGDLAGAAPAGRTSTTPASTPTPGRATAPPAETENASASLVFDAPLADAVRRFQYRHRLKEDGIVTPGVVAAMNVPVEERIRQLDLNLERLRWLPDKMPDRYIRVNVPEYKLDVIESGHTVMDIRVVVGGRDLPTPIFADDMTSVVFSPYWNIPRSIAEKETIPHAERDPDFLARNNIEMVHNRDGSWSFRQRPGPHNALGLVKFVFPNNFNVYLHDTPADSLFSRLQRDLSHGCVRVEEPVKLAEYVLRDQPEWTREKIVAAMEAGREQWVKLKTPIPVFILYMTAVADPSGTVRFLDDIYGHDAGPTGAPTA